MNRTACFLVTSVVLVVCCGSNFLPKKATVWLKRVSFVADEDANGGSPFACHIVITYDDAMKEQMVGFDSQTYFNKIDKMEKDRKKELQVLRFDIIPGRNQLNKKIKVRSYSKATSAYLFAKYSAKGDFKQEIASSIITTVKFQKNKIVVEDKKKKE